MQYKRLKKSGDFQRLFKKGKKVYAPRLTVIYAPAKGESVMGIALSKKHGKAVKRNRIKRLLRAAFANNISRLAAPYSLIIMPKVSESYSYSELESSLLICFRRMEK